MVGHLLLEEARGRRPRVEVIRAAGVRLLQARVPVRPGLGPGAVERRLGRAAAALRQGRVRRVLAPAGFGYWDSLTAWGLRGVDAAPLCQALAAPLALAALAGRGVPPAEAVAALRGARVSRPLFQAAEALCPCVRGLVVSAGPEGEELARYLREEYGVAVREEGAEAHVTIEFSPGREGRPGALRLYGERPDLAGLALGAPQEAALDVDPLPWLAVLWESGCLPLREIEIFPADAEGN